MLNKPAGTNFINWDAKDAKATLRIDNHKVIRSKGASGNTYELDDEKYSAFGNNVPSTIENVMQVNEDNFQWQHDTPFWFAESAGEVNRRLNQIVSLDIIDKVMSGITRIETQNATLMKSTECDIIELKNRCDKLKAVVQVKKDWHKVTKIQNKIDALQDKIVCVRSLLNSIKECEANSITPPPFKPVSTAYEAYQTKHKQFIKLKRIILQIADYTEEVEYRNTNLAQIDKALKKEKRCPICQRKLKVNTAK